MAYRVFVTDGQVYEFPDHAAMVIDGSDYVFVVGDEEDTSPTGVRRRPRRRGFARLTERTANQGSPSDPRSSRRSRKVRASRGAAAPDRC